MAGYRSDSWPMGNIANVRNLEMRKSKIWRQRGETWRRRNRKSQRQEVLFESWSKTHCGKQIRCDVIMQIVPAARFSTEITPETLARQNSS